jgi:hypothetical protein
MSLLSTTDSTTTGTKATMSIQSLGTGGFTMMTTIDEKTMAMTTATTNQNKTTYSTNNSKSNTNTIGCSDIDMAVISRKRRPSMLSLRRLRSSFSNSSIGSNGSTCSVIGKTNIHNSDTTIDRHSNSSNKLRHRQHRQKIVNNSTNNTNTTHASTKVKKSTTVTLSLTMTLSKTVGSPDQEQCQDVVNNNQQIPKSLDIDNEFNDLFRNKSNSTTTSRPELLILPSPTTIPVGDKGQVQPVQQVDDLIIPQTLTEQWLGGEPTKYNPIDELHDINNIWSQLTLDEQKAIYKTDTTIPIRHYRAEKVRDLSIVCVYCMCKVKICILLLDNNCILYNEFFH